VGRTRGNLNFKRVGRLWNTTAWHVYREKEAKGLPRRPLRCPQEGKSVPCTGRQVVGWAGNGEGVLGVLGCPLTHEELLSWVQPCYHRELLSASWPPTSNAVRRCRPPTTIRSLSLSYLVLCACCCKRNCCHSPRLLRRWRKKSATFASYFLSFSNSVSRIDNVEFSKDSVSVVKTLKIYFWKIYFWKYILKITKLCTWGIERLDENRF